MIFTKDEVEGLMRTDGTPLEASKERSCQGGTMWSTTRTREAAAPPPSLRNPGETLPSDYDPKNQVRVMRAGAVSPSLKQDPQPGDNPDGAPDSSQPAASSTSLLLPDPTGGSFAAPCICNQSGTKAARCWRPATGDGLR